MSKISPRLLICAGGTGGGVYPALAVLLTFLNNNSFTGVKRSDEKAVSSIGQPRVLWVGSIGGMESGLVKRIGIPYTEISAGGLHGVGWNKLPGNIMSLFKGFRQSQRIIHDFQPQVMFFTGGYLAVPMALAGKYSRRRLPKPKILLYVPDIEPGLALKTLAKFADHLALTTESSAQYFGKIKLTTVTGYPVRRELIDWVNKPNKRAIALEYFGFSDKVKTLFVYGGSKGAHSINRALLAILPELLQKIQIVHICGDLDWPEVQKHCELMKKQFPERLINRYRVFPYLHQEMGAAFTVADLIVCRAGASILGELPLFGKPAILIPYPYAWRYQITNARYLEQHRCAVILYDDELGNSLLPKIFGLINDDKKLKEMQASMCQLSKPEAAKNIAQIIYQMGSIS